MDDREYFERAVKRVARMTDRTLTESEIIIALEKEINRYRDKIGHLENHIEVLKTRSNTIYGTTQLEAVQENTAAKIIKALADNGYNTITINCYKDIESEV